MCSSDNKMGNNNVLNSNNRGTHTLIGDMRMQVGNKFSNLQISEAISTFFRKTGAHVQCTECFLKRF